MKFLIGFSVFNAVDSLCAIAVRNQVDCQNVCDIMPTCGVWSFNKERALCEIKTDWSDCIRRGNSNYDSGFKDGYPHVDKNVAYYGGDYEDCKCGQ